MRVSQIIQNSLNPRLNAPTYEHLHLCRVIVYIVYTEVGMIGVRMWSCTWDAIER